MVNKCWAYAISNFSRRVMVFYGVLPYLLGIHALLAVVLLALSVYGYTKVKVNIERRILLRPQIHFTKIIASYNFF